MRPPLPNAADRIPGLSVTVGEVDRACYFLVGHGWAGGISFDEAVKALAQDADGAWFTVDLLAAALLALDEKADTDRIWRAMNNQQLAAAIIQAAKEAERDDR